MQELEKILEEIEQEKLKHWDSSERLETDKLMGWCFDKCTEIIRKHMADAPENDGWIPVEERLPEKPENGYQEPEYNVMIKDAIIPTTLKFTSKGKWKDDLGQEYEIIAWRPLPEPYRPEGSDCDGK